MRCSQFSVKIQKPCLPPVEAETSQQEFAWTLARDKYQVREKRFLYLHEVLFPISSCHKVSTTRCSCEVCRGRPLWSPLDFWSVSFGRLGILCLLANTDYIIKVVTVLSRSHLNSLNGNMIYCYSCEYIHIYFCIWNPNPGIYTERRRDGTEVRSEFHCDWKI